MSSSFIVYSKTYRKCLFFIDNETKVVAAAKKQDDKISYKHHIKKKKQQHCIYLSKKAKTITGTGMKI